MTGRDSLVNYVLIHGGAHGPWCWQRLIPFLLASETVENVIALDLLEDALAVESKAVRDVTAADYVEGAVRRIEALDLADVVLVGHSMAGITIPAVVYRLPQRVRRVIYLATSNPPVGQSVESLMQHPLSPLSRGVDFERMFCNDLDPDSARWLLSNLRADPVQPFSQPVDCCVLPEGVPSTYVVFDRDQALLSEFQLEQAGNAQVDEIRHFDAGHSGYVSKPRELAQLLLEYARGSVD